MSIMFRTLDTFDTEFSADSVEWCPVEPHGNVFACGTYQLLKGEDKLADKRTSSKRIGRIYLMRVLNGGKFELLQQLELPAVLDMKWAHIRCFNKTLLAVVTAAGELRIYRLDEDKLSLNIITQTRVNDDDETLVLSLDWNLGKRTSENCSEPKIAVSDSKGFVSLYAMSEENLSKTFCAEAHEYEAWIVAFDYWDTNRVYTGGDDCKLKCFDARTGTNSIACNRSHGAGVTSLHSNAKKEFLLASGSYDEILRLWDVRNLKRTISETNLRGGIWRLKWDPFVRRYLLAACMYGGFRLIDCKIADSPVILGEYNEHESISYGCDWAVLTDNEILQRNILETAKSGDCLTSTCSFYDHQLKLSTLCLEFE